MEQQDDVESNACYSADNVRMWFLPNRILWEDHSINDGNVQQVKLLKKSFFHPDILQKWKTVPHSSIQ